MQDQLFFVWIIAVTGIGVLVGIRRFIACITIMDFQRALVYTRGRYRKQVGAGVYYHLKGKTKFQVFDLRQALYSLPPQEVVSKDNVSLKITLSGFYHIHDGVKLYASTQNLINTLHAYGQAALRGSISQYTLEELLEKKSEISLDILHLIQTKAEAIGITVTECAIRDIMLPANLKKAFSAVLQEKKEAQRQLEKARGEQAVLRSLSNTAALYENNPALLQARIVQSLDNGRNTIVLNNSTDKLLPITKV